MIDTNLLIIMGAAGAAILLCCYVIIKIVLRKELEDGLPTQIKAIRDIFGKDEITLTINIAKDGKVRVDGFDIKQKVDYVG